MMDKKMKKKMSGKKWISKMGMKEGALHKMMGIPMDKKIPAKKMAKAAKSGSKLMKKRVVLAKTLKKLSKKKKKSY